MEATDAVPVLSDPAGALVYAAKCDWAAFRDVFRRHGPVVRVETDARPHLFICTPEHNQSVLSRPHLFHLTEDDSFPFRCPPESAVHRLARGIAWMNGAEHERHRAMMMPAYHRRFVEVYADTVVRLTREHLAEWRPGEDRDLTADLGRLALEISFEILYGRRARGDGAALCARIDEYCRAVAALPPDATPASLGAEWDALLARAEGVEAALAAEMAAKRRSPPDIPDTLSMLVAARDEHGEGMTDDEIAAHALTLSLVGNPSVSSTLWAVLVLLAQHPEWAARVLDELEGELHGGPADAARLDRLPLLEAVVFESLRLLPAGIWGQRDAVRDANVGEHPVRAGTRVVYDSLVTHRLPDVYPEPYRFRPERWLNGQPSPYAYLAFGAGPRLCIGRALSLMQVKLVLSL
ncbi:MAG: cytochrome P450, partial [Gemmatimonadetes bacterium]|nr:cytochrome P450 [Gemmatimonadota bacterium]